MTPSRKLRSVVSMIEVQGCLGSRKLTQPHSTVCLIYPCYRQHPPKARKLFVSITWLQSCNPMALYNVTIILLCLTRFAFGVTEGHVASPKTRRRLLAGCPYVPE
eukprot:5600908-Pleurochrysis_carterae.AAC.1